MTPGSGPLDPSLDAILRRGTSMSQYRTRRPVLVRASAEFFEQGQWAEEPRSQQPPPYKVILHSNAAQDLMFVVRCVMELTRFPRAEATYKMWQAHHCGRSVILLTYRDDSIADRYKHTIATAWRLSFERLRQQDPVAAQILDACAFLQPDAIPLIFFENQSAVLLPPVANEIRLEKVSRLIAFEQEFENRSAGFDVQIEGPVDKFELFDTALEQKSQLAQQFGAFASGQTPHTQGLQIRSLAHR